MGIGERAVEVSAGIKVSPFVINNELQFFTIYVFFVHFLRTFFDRHMGQIGLHTHSTYCY